MIKQGIILAGGKGQRLYPYTKKIPKPLVNIKGKPFLYYLIKQLEKFNFKQVTILAGYKSEKFDNFKKIELSDGKKGWIEASAIKELKI